MTHTILIIEDHKDIAYLAASILRKEGYQVILTGSGEDGLRQLDEQVVDLLLLDIMLPGIDGWEVCRRIRASASWVSLPILLFTGRSANNECEKTERALFDGVITKPFERAELVGTIQAALAPVPV